MKHFFLKAAFTLSLCAPWSPGYGHDAPHDVVPDAEKKVGKSLMKNAPTQTKGVSSVKVLGSLPLGKEFPTTAGRTFRVRTIVVQPGGVVAVHQHHQRPGMAYILEGEMVETRSDREGSIVHGPGSVAFEKTGVTHYWENKTKKPAKALVVDIVAES